ncbi:MAG: SGNH/GDSL hydrolase family protein [Myxococcota bacterium]
MIRSNLSADRRMSRSGLSAATLVAGLVTPLLFSASASALDFSNLIVFGDSIVDTGNTQAAVVGAGFPDPAPAGAGYFGGRFTNGINPADVLNNEIEGTNAVGSIFGGDNYSFGGARARDDGDFLPDVVNQVISYTTTLGGGGIDPNALIMINVGGNDVRDIVINGLTGAARQGIIDDAVTAISSAVSFLQLAGAQNILFTGVGDVGGIPEILALGGTAPVDGRQASEDMNAAIQAALPGDVTFFDTISFFDQVQANPAAFGLPVGINLTDACVGTADAPTCTNYAFFDTVHPTTQLLQVLGAELVTVVPEPGTGLLMMLGLAGLASGRRQQA